MILPLQGDRGVDEAERRELEIRTVSEDRGVVLEARERRRGRATGAALNPV